MARVLAYVADKFTAAVKTVKARFTDDKISKIAEQIGDIFSQESDGVVFLQSVTKFFQEYNQSNASVKNSNFSNDVGYITECTLASLTSYDTLDIFSNRIDSYFYIYRQILEYINMVKQSSSKQDLEKKAEELKQKLFQQLASVFKSTKGEQPNLQTKEVQLLKRMNIAQFLNSIKKIDNDEMLTTFFALCKLTFQSSLIHDERALQWKDVLLSVKSISISLEILIKMYTDHNLAFQVVPLDIPGFIVLISKTNVSKDSNESPFHIYIQLLKDLHLDIEIFFAEFQNTFKNGVQNKHYKFEHVEVLLLILSKYDELFGKYLSMYGSIMASAQTWNNLWEMFLRLSETIDLNEAIQQHLTSILPKYFQNFTFSNFKEIMTSAFGIRTKIKTESQTNFTQILKATFDAFIEELFKEENYLNELNYSYLKDLLDIGLELLSIDLYEDHSCLLLIKRILFKPERSTSKKGHSMLSQFNNLNDFNSDLCKNNDPNLIIQDEWLTDYVLKIPEEWIDLDELTYQSLCEKHNKNRWAIYIWTKCVHLGLLKSHMKNPHDIIVKVNEWMSKVQHTVFTGTDTLTTIFAIEIFEFIIIKNMDSVMSLPNIELILNFVLGAAENQLHEINKKNVDNFKRTVQESIKNLLLLNGKSGFFSISIKYMLSEVIVI
ncbi:unnamed protein product [Rotaria magnacalcarata]|uniref:Uncharacterized protein n=1 Tax=Rotaria magnacalcarata TaxID=392030 RepID=A0A816YW43_9BILA|nr:unnamed protein product [Rotaria magnacalcarata]CAF4181336.1 unnamed protein product [Rotaria magnacalcarata]